MMPQNVESEIAISYQVAAFGQPASDTPWDTGRSGENISAVEVESVLAQHPAVKAVAVAPTPDDVRGDEVLACVVLRESAGDAALAAEITRHALQQLAYYKAPGYVAFVDALPLTLSQKVQRAQLKTLAATLPGTPRCFDTRALKKRQA